MTELPENGTSFQKGATNSAPVLKTFSNRTLTILPLCPMTTGRSAAKSPAIFIRLCTD